MLLQDSRPGVPATQGSPRTPALHVVTPLEEHAPKPQLVGVLTKSSSTAPLQSSSMLSQVWSSTAACPGVHVSPVTPPVQVVTPLDEHAPMPQLVGVPTKSSSTAPLQSSSMLSQVWSSTAACPGVHV